jgi:hypothetical protein
MLLRNGDDGAAALRRMNRAWRGRCRLRAQRRDVAAGIGVALKPQQLGAHIRGVLITKFAIFLKITVDDVFQPGWKFWIQPQRGSRGFVQDAIEDYARTFTSKGRLYSRICWYVS